MLVLGGSDQYLESVMYETRLTRLITSLAISHMSDAGELSYALTYSRSHIDEVEAGRGHGEEKDEGH